MRLVFPIGGDSDKGQHSLGPFERRLRVRPSFDVVASAGAVKSLQKYNYLRQSTDSPKLLIRQGKKNVSGTRAQGWLTRDAGILREQRKNSPHNTDHLG